MVILKIESMKNRELHVAGGHSEFQVFTAKFHPWSINFAV